MRKIVYILLTPIICFYAYAFASSYLFPSTSQFPRIPISGGIGKVLALVLGTNDISNSTGMVTNAARLNGISSDNYLKNTSCPSGQYWIGVDATGKGICNGSSTLLTTTLGTITNFNGNVQIEHSGSSSWIPVTSTGITVVA